MGCSQSKEAVVVPQSIPGLPECTDNSPPHLGRSEAQMSTGLQIVRSRSCISIKSDESLIPRSSFLTRPRRSMRPEAAKQSSEIKHTARSTDYSSNHNNQAASNDTTNQAQDNITKSSLFSDYVQTYKPVIKISVQPPRTVKIKQRNLLDRTGNTQTAVNRHSGIPDEDHSKVARAETGGFGNYLKSCLHEDIGYSMLLRTPKMGQPLNISFQEVADMSMEAPQLPNDESKASNGMQADRLDVNPAARQTKPLQSLHDLSFAVIDLPDNEQASPDVNRQSLVTNGSKVNLSELAIADAGNDTKPPSMLKLKVSKIFAVSQASKKSDAKDVSYSRVNIAANDSLFRNSRLANKSAFIKNQK